VLSSQSKRSCFKVAASMRVPPLSSRINCHWLINVSIICMLWCFVLRARLPGVATISRIRLRVVILIAVLLFLLVIALSVASITGSFSRTGHLSGIFVLEV